MRSCSPCQARSRPTVPPRLTDVHDIEGQPVEEGVAHQLGKEQAKGELHHALGGEEVASEEPPSPSLPRMPGFFPNFHPLMG